MRRFLSSVLSLISAISLGITSPAMAQTAAGKAENTQKALLATLDKATHGQNVRVLDAGGNPLAPEKLAAQPNALRDGLSVESGAHRILVRGELLREGKDGVKLFLTHFVNNQASNGQVVTLSAGITTREFAQRLNDARESLFLNTLEAKHAGSTERKVASSGGDLNCGTKHLLIQITTVIFFVSLLGFLVGGVTRPKVVSVFITMATMGMAWVTSPGDGNTCR